MFMELDTEFAVIIYGSVTRRLIAACDPIGIRPLYYGYDKSGSIILASEPKNLVGLTDRTMPSPPGRCYKDRQFVKYSDPAQVDGVSGDDMDTVCFNIYEKLIAGIEKRLDSDAPVGVLLSVGLDSSLVCSVAQRL